MPDRVGQQIGNYRLVKLLGKGGFADVYLGQHVHIASRQAAIKILHLIDVDVGKFKQEAETTAKLEHPHIVRLLDFAIEEGTPFLVLDFALGGSLRTRHSKGSLVPLATVEAYLKEIAPALQHAHDQHVLHRDIKPDNILIGRGGELLLSDFGIAVLTQTGRTSFSSAYGIGGTPYYMAPETYRGRPVKESDQYALAVVVYEWLCGGVPFSEGDFIQLGFQHSYEPVPPLREKNPAIPPEVEAVIKTALAKEPNDRFASVQTFVQAFEQACIPTLPVPQPQSVHHISDKQLPPDQSSQKGKEQHPGQDETGVKVTDRPVPPDGMPGRITEPPLETAVEPKIPVPPPPEVPSSPGTNMPTTIVAHGVVADRRLTRRKMLIGFGVVAALIIGGTAWWELSHGPSGSTVTASSELIPSSTPTPDPTPIPVGTTLSTYRGHTASVTSVAWSADGTRIASASFDGTVRVWDAMTGENALYSYTAPSRKSMWSVAWSPDRGFIVSGCADAAAYVWDAINGGEAQLTYKGHKDSVNAVQWSPSDSYIASGSADYTAQVWLVNGASSPVTHAGHSAPVTGVGWSHDSQYIVTASRDKTARVWNALTSERARLTYTGHSDKVNGVSWSRDGKHIASTSDDNTVQVWDPTSGHTSVIYRGHVDHVNPVAWSPDSQLIASGSWDRTVQVWEASSGKLLLTYKGHADHVNAVAWSPNGKYIASGGVDKTIQIWKVLS
jgi:eukaryotic-like serine/threonine-protein kinase